MKYMVILACLLLQEQASGQKMDTLVIGPEHITTKKLSAGTHHWLSYNVRENDTLKKNLILWQVKIDPVVYHDKPAISIRQLVTGRDTVMMATHTICDASTFVTRYHEARSSFAPALDMDFENKTLSVNGKPITPDDTARSSKTRWQRFDSSASGFALNWSIDLATFPLLPYKANRTFLINFFEPGAAPHPVAYTVTGTGFLYSYDNNKIECWVLECKHRFSTQKFYISKKTSEMLKLEEEFGKTKVFKVKQGFL
jgi:hypothetical protein